MRIKFEGVDACISNEDYHAAKEYISRSAIMDFCISPYNYWSKHLNPDRPMREPTPQMEFGTAFHAFILEPALFQEIYGVIPPKVLLKDVGKELYTQFKSRTEEIENTGKKIILHEDYQRLSVMRNNIFNEEGALELIKDARIEHSFFWKDGQSELMVKARPDILHKNMIVDLKTAADASPRAFQRAMVDGGYHIQGAMIRDGVEKLEGNRIDNVINIVVETKYPYHVGIYIIDEEALNVGEKKYKQVLVDINRAIGNNEFTGFDTQTIGLPTWLT